MLPKKTILSVVGTRPNFMKVGPLEDILKDKPHIHHVILHTGQHYDNNMSDDFFRDFSMRKPDIRLGVHGGLLGDQTGRIMIAFEKALLEVKPDLVVVVGDVNSTFAAAWVAVQNHIPVAHVEAGLRSFDRAMPEEINRLCTDVIADLLFTTHPDADQQLIKEGVDPKKIFMVGDIMIDYVVRFRERALAASVWERFGCQAGKYGLVTLHRPSNVDNPEKLRELTQVLIEISKELPLIFAVHPRTLKNLNQTGLIREIMKHPTLKVSEPLSYLNFLSLIMSSALLLTDSGGIQEETSFLNIPCLTLRENTERGFCIEHGTNTLVGTSAEKILSTFRAIRSGNAKQTHAMPGWDGKTAERIVKVLEDFLYDQRYR